MTTIGRPIQLKIVENNNEMSSIPTYEAQVSSILGLKIRILIKKSFKTQ